MFEIAGGILIAVFVLAFLPTILEIAGILLMALLAVLALAAVIGIAIHLGLPELLSWLITLPLVIHLLVFCGFVLCCSGIVFFCRDLYQQFRQPERAGLRGAGIGYLIGSCIGTFLLVAPLLCAGVACFLFSIGRVPG